MQSQVQALLFLFRSGAQSDHGINQFQQDEAHRRAIKNRHAGSRELLYDLSPHAHSLLQTHSAEAAVNEYTRQDGADKAANTVNAKSIQRVVITKRAFSLTTAK